MSKHLHIISPNIPFPADHGGSCDVFYQLVALQAAGVNIHLHCFEYDHSRQSELNRYCVSVNYYPRHMGHKGISTSLPYVVASRKNDALLETLLLDEYPIVMDGIHCTYPLVDERFSHRKCFVRLHHVEYRYYRDLCHATPSLLQKLYFLRESMMLRRYEKRVAAKACFWGITEQDGEVYRHEFGCQQIAHLPLYLPSHWTVQCAEGTGAYCLYHGDLGIDTNEKAASWLLKNVFNDIAVPFLIAGRNPSPTLARQVKNGAHACLVANPTEREMQDMIAKAQVNILPSNTHTGIKLKLVNALFHGRHCVVNDATAHGSGLEPACHIASTANAFKEMVARLYYQPFTADEVEQRKRLLGNLFNSERNAQRQVEQIWGGDL